MFRRLPTPRGQGCPRVHLRGNHRLMLDRIQKVISLEWTYSGDLRTKPFSVGSLLLNVDHRTGKIQQEKRAQAVHWRNFLSCNEERFEVQTLLASGNSKMNSSANMARRHPGFLFSPGGQCCSRLCVQTGPWGAEEAGPRGAFRNSSQIMPGYSQGRNLSPSDRV